MLRSGSTPLLVRLSDQHGTKSGSTGYQHEHVLDDLPSLPAQQIVATNGAPTLFYDLRSRETRVRQETTDDE